MVPAIDLTQWEIRYWQDHYLVAGVDEVGRGPLAGPVVAAVVIFEPGQVVDGINDSKKLSALQRERLYPQILDQARAVGIGSVGVGDIEIINILEASRLAMRRALWQLPEVPDVVLTDGMQLGGPWREVAILYGDAVSASVGAASIVAKVVRDRYMQEIDQQYPKYGFAQHKGYGTRQHQAAVLQFGPCPEHRLTFLRRLLSGNRVASRDA